MYNVYKFLDVFPNFIFVFCNLALLAIDAAVLVLVKYYLMSDRKKCK